MRYHGLAALISLICLSASAAIAQEGDVAAGETVFKKCAVCHIADTDKNKVGPSLNHLFGRTAGTHPDFAYSAAMKAAGIPWSRTRLQTYIADPATTIPGVRMRFVGPGDAAARDDLIEYLASLH